MVTLGRVIPLSEAASDATTTKEMIGRGTARQGVGTNLEHNSLPSYRSAAI